MAKVFFVDDRLDEVGHQWHSSGCDSDHELLPLEKFASIERTCLLVETFNPDVVLVGYGLGEPGITGADVIHSLRERGYSGYIIANSGGSVEQFNKTEVNGTANRNSHDLKMVVDNLTGRS